MEANPRSDERTMNGPKSDQGDVCNFPGTLNVIIAKIYLGPILEGEPHGPHTLQNNSSPGASYTPASYGTSLGITRTKEGRGDRVGLPEV